MRNGRRIRYGGVAIPATLLVVAGTLMAGRTTAVSAQQPPTFRSSVDLVAVDVQVVDKTGRPIGSLKPGDFEVEIAGKKRRVVSADFIESASVDSTSGGAGMAKWRPERTGDAPAEPGSGRTFVLAFDTDSFTVGESRDVVAAARTFIHELRPNDSVGLYTFPVGPRHEPTLEHVTVSKLVDTIVGRSQSMIGEYNLSPAEIVDITAETARDFARATALSTTATPGGASTTGTNANANASGGNNGSTAVTVADTALQRVQLRECGALESSCADSIRAEANSKAFYLEGRATEGLNGLRSLIQLLGEQPGRKTVLVMSTGIPATDRPGGRPDVGDIAKLLGQDAAATNTTIYTLLVNTRGFQSMASETRKNDRIPTSLSRDNAVASRLLEEFSGASGGALIRVLLGGGEVALDRILRETSSHYLLGVEPADVDRDGKLRELRVKVGQSGATIRARSWVVVPKKKL
ncbi:MAG: VWA domain-containing protein [Acidobacteriota bacterium]